MTSLWAGLIAWSAFVIIVGLFAWALCWAAGAADRKAGGGGDE